MNISKFKRNAKYIKAIPSRVYHVGIMNFLKEWILYSRKYISLPKKIALKPTFKYRIFVIHNYLRIIWFKPDISKYDLLNIIPKSFAKGFLAHITNPLDQKYQLVDKVFFYQKMAEHKIPFPKTYFYKKGPNYYTLDDIQIQKFLMYEGKEMFIKAIDGSSGQDVGIINFKYEPQMYQGKDLIFQELVRPHTDIRKMSPVRAASTIRVNSYLSKDGTIEIDSAFIKFPSLDAISDNMDNGSLGVAIDFNSGKLKGAPISTNSDLKSNKTINNEHPLSGMKFNGFQIPHWPDLIKLLEKLHAIFPNLKFIGWDILITDSGPMVIEGNSVGDVILEQVISQPYFNTKYIQENICN